MRHLPNTSTGCFRLALFGKPRHWGQSECSSLIGWFLDMVYFQQWSRTESKTPHVTLLGRSYWISYIHTRSKKTKETKKLIYSIGNFLCNKIPCFCHHVESYQPRLVPLPAAIPSSDETGRYARISPVAILTGSVSLTASRMSASGFGNTRPITPHRAR